MTARTDANARLEDARAFLEAAETIDTLNDAESYADVLAESAQGCIGPTAEYRNWTRTFLEAPLSYSRDKETLVLRNNTGRITFQESKGSW